MKRGAAPLIILFLLTLLLSPLAVVKEVDAVSYEDYPGQYKKISSFDCLSDESTTYGNWTFTPSYSNGTATSSSRTFGSPYIEGLAAVQLSFQVNPTYSAGDYLEYEFVSNQSRNLLQLHTPVFTYRGNYSSYVSAAIHAYALNATGTVLNFQGNELILDDQWYTTSFDYLFHPDAAYYQIIVRLGTMVWDQHVGDFGAGNLSMDLMYAESPPCSVRFSFYNEYSGLGLISELLIPEVYYDGSWTRVWNNEITIAAGESIAYRVRDYFNRTLELVLDHDLDETIEYLDISVPLVTVHISQPDWYNSTLPPEWQITYMPNGNSISATGWSLELIAGWYTFSWPDDGVRVNGSVEEYVVGNSTASSSYAMFDFTLSMDPTYEGSGSTFGDTFLPDLNFLTFDGLKNTVAAIYSSWEFKAIAIFGTAISTLFFVYRANKIAKEEVKR